MLGKRRATRLVPADILEVLRHEVNQPQEIALDNLENPSKDPRSRRSGSTSFRAYQR